MASVEDHVAKARDRQNEVDVAETEEGLDVNNTSHTTQVTLHTLVILLIQNSMRIIVTRWHWLVLDDGTILHINKTTIADTDEDGNSFFFHRAVIHNIAPEAEDEEAAEVDDVVDNVFDAEDDESVPQLPYEDEDTGIDAGLLDI